MFKDRNLVTQLVRRAERAGYKAIVLTADTPRLGRRDADIKNRFTMTPSLTLKNFENLDLGKIDETNDSGLASYVAGLFARSLSWKWAVKDRKWYTQQQLDEVRIEVADYLQTAVDSD